MTRHFWVETRGSSTQSAASRPSVTTDSAETVYHGYRDLTAQVGKVCTVTAGGEPLGFRYDLLSAPRSVFEWGHRGSGPEQLAHAFDDGRKLNAPDLDAWCREVAEQ